MMRATAPSQPGRIEHDDVGSLLSHEPRHVVGIGRRGGRERHVAELAEDGRRTRVVVASFATTSVRTAVSARVEGIDCELVPPGSMRALCTGLRTA
jgi:hypothetical protein